MSISTTVRCNFAGVSITSTPVEQTFSGTEHQTHKNTTPSSANALITISAGVRGNQVRTMNKKRDDDEDMRAKLLNKSKADTTIILLYHQEKKQNTTPAQQRIPFRVHYTS